MDFVIYDLETTGLRPESEEIIQIAAMKFRNGQLMAAESFASYAKPSRPISPFITNYTGISNFHVAQAPRPEEALLAFARFIGDSCLIAHNGLRFDSKFLHTTCLRHQLPHRQLRSIDSIVLSKRLFGTIRGTGHSLDRLLSRLNISSHGHARHDARGDVALLGRAIESLWGKLNLDAVCSGIPTHLTTVPEPNT